MREGKDQRIDQYMMSLSLSLTHVYKEVLVAAPARDVWVKAEEVES